MKAAFVGVFLAAIALAGCQTLKEAQNVAKIGVEFDWSNVKLCNYGKLVQIDSPKFTLTNVPAGTKAIRFQMIDLDYNNWNHGGDEVAYDGGMNIPAGAFKYNSPCPPSPNVNRYKWTVLALDEKKETILGRGEAIKKYPPQ